MSSQTAPMLPFRSRAPGYRERAAEARRKAESLTDEAARETMLNSADLWDRMADYEVGQEARRDTDHLQA